MAPISIRLVGFPLRPRPTALLVLLRLVCQIGSVVLAGQTLSGAAALSHVDCLAVVVVYEYQALSCQSGKNA